MTVVIKKSDTAEQAKKKLEMFFKNSAKARKKRGFPARKFAGLGIFKGADPLLLQKQMRDEWDR